MGYDGSGNYTRQRNFSADASAGIRILASAMDQEVDDIASAFNNVLPRDGQAAMTGNLPMGGNRLINVGASQAANDYIRVREVIENVPIYMLDTTTSADTVSVSASYFTSVSATQAPRDGTKVMIRMASDKSSAPVMRFSGHSANVHFAGGGVVDGLVSGAVYELTYASAEGVWETYSERMIPRTAAEITAGVTPTNYQYEPYNIKRYGATGDGATDDTTAIQSAITACPAFGTVIFPDGTYVVGSLLTVSTDNIRLSGTAKLVAKAATDFSVMLTLSGRTGCVVEGLEFDINGSNRSGVQTQTYNAISFASTTDCSMIECTIRNARGYSGTSATAVAASSVTRFRADGCKFIDCGVSATSEASDGLFVRGDGCEIVNCQAYRCTDHAYVLEGCNHSIISNCVALQCTAIAAISNDTASDCVGNRIDGVTGSCLYVGSTGGIMSVTCFGTGDLLQVSISNVIIRIDPTATNLGPGIQIRHTDTGRPDGVHLENVSIDTGAASGVLAQGMLIQDSDNVVISNPFIRQDLTAGTDCIKFDGSCVGGQVNGGRLIKGTRGINVADSAAVLVMNVQIQDQDDYGINAGDTSSVTSRGNVITGASLLGFENKAAGATLISDYWQSWTPTYSSDIGDAATTFSGAVTTTRASYRIVGKRAEVEVYYAATLNAVTPNYVELTLPSGADPSGDNSRNPSDVLNNATRETGIVRAISTGSGSLRVFRANLVNYSSGVAVEGSFAFAFEIT